MSKSHYRKRAPFVRDSYSLLKWIQANAKSERMPSPSIEIAVTGVQNRRILSGLLLRRLAAKNKAKNETARIQNKGEKRLSRKPAATAAKPVALELLIPQRAETSPGPSRAANIAATALRMPRRVTGLSPGYSRYSTQKRFLMMVRRCKIARSPDRTQQRNFSKSNGISR